MEAAGSLGARVSPQPPQFLSAPRKWPKGSGRGAL